MADLNDVSKGLVSAIAGILFSGTYSPGQEGTSVLTWTAPMGGTQAACHTIQLYPGWPASNDLTGDLVAGKAHVSVFPDPGMTRLTTRFPRRWMQQGRIVPTLTISSAGDRAAFGAGVGRLGIDPLETGEVLTTELGPVVVFGGTASAAHVVGLIVTTDPLAAGRGVLGVSPVQQGLGATYAYRCTADDTPASVAAALAAAIPGAQADGVVLTVPGAVDYAVVVCDQIALREVRRQQQGFRVSCWAPTPQAREMIAGAIDLALADTPWLALADGTTGRLLYRATYTDDLPSKDRLWRRDLCYTVEYPTVQSQIQPVMLFPGSTLNGGGAVMVASGSVLAGTAPIPGLTVSDGALAATVKVF